MCAPETLFHAPYSAKRDFGDFLYTALLHARYLSHYVMHVVQRDRASAACLQLHIGCPEGLRLTCNLGKTALLVGTRSKKMPSLVCCHFCTRHASRGHDTRRQKMPRLACYPGCTPYAGRGEDTSLNLNKLLQLLLVIIAVHDQSHDDYVYRFCHHRRSRIPAAAQHAQDSLLTPGSRPLALLHSNLTQCLIHSRHCQWCWPVQHGLHANTRAEQCNPAILADEQPYCSGTHSSRNIDFIVPCVMLINSKPGYNLAAIHRNYMQQICRAYTAI